MKKLYLKKITLFIALQFCFLIAVSQESNTQSFEEYKKQQQAEYNNYLESETKAFDEYLRQEQQAFDNFKKEIENYWGKDDFKTSTKKDWVEYSDDKKQRTDVDFENGTAEVEILLTETEAKNPEIVKNELKDAVENLVNSKGKTKDYSTEAEEPEALLDEPVLEGQISNEEGKIVEPEDSEEFAEEVIENQQVEVEEVKGEDGKSRYKVSLSLSLAPDHIKVRAEKVEQNVNQYAKQFGLAVELVYAVIHTESYFNPKARSWVPAFGLMQIVPKYAGRDAYNYVYKEDKLLPANYLYQSDKNIELGTAYLKLLMTRELKKIKDPECKQLCAIASYNTGAGNLSRAFTGKTNIRSASNQINKLDYDELYEFLSVNLPYDETRKYIKKVTERMKLYKDWMGN